MNSWSDLPNAAHIDAVIASARQHLDAWTAAWNATSEAASDAVGDAAYSAAWDATYSAALFTGRAATYSVARSAAWTADPMVRDTLLALVAYDDCAKYLDMTAEQLEVWARLSDEPAAVLLLPYVRVLERIKQAECSGEHCSE